MAYRDEHAAWFDQWPGPILCLASNGVDYHIHLMDDVLEGCRMVVNHRFRAQRADKLQVVLGRGADDVSALPARKLNRIVAHTASCAMDQDPLPGLQIGQNEKRYPGGARAYWY